MGQLFIEIQHVVLILMVFLLILDHLLPFNRHYLISILFFITPLDTENIAFLAETEDDVVELHRKELAVLEDFETLASDYVVD